MNQQELSDYILIDMQMYVIRAIVKAGLAARQRLNIPVRQPLASITISSQFIEDLCWEYLNKKIIQQVYLSRP